MKSLILAVHLLTLVASTFCNSVQQEKSSLEFVKTYEKDCLFSSEAKLFDELDRRNDIYKKIYSRENKPNHKWPKRGYQLRSAWHKRENQPPGIWGKRENRPFRIWGKKTNQPPGMWDMGENQISKMWNDKEN